jgi:oligopeptide/dipeptide ABC transporter ATP-binding protein
MTALLEIEDLEVTFHRSSLAGALAGRGRVSLRAVNGVSLSVARGETLGLVGESGCGKSTLARAVLRLVEPSGGRVRFDGADVLGLDGASLFKMRERMQMVFQDPFGSLNPQLTVGSTLSEVYRVHRLCAASEISGRVRQSMRDVGLPQELLDRRPAALSGGQCQRVGIARALAVRPDLVIADEAVSALDVSIQAQILNLFADLQRRMELTLIFISHDLGVVRHLCRKLAVMYLGRIVEYGPTEEIFQDPKHPYTQALIEAMPRMSAKAPFAEAGLGGEPPSPTQIPSGCAFNPRCRFAFPSCRADPPPARCVISSRAVWCHLYDEEAPGDSN